MTFGEHFGKNFCPRDLKKKGFSGRAGLELQNFLNS